MTGRKKKPTLIEMYLIAAGRKAPSPLLNIWVRTRCPAINFQHCKTLSFFFFFFMSHDPSFIHPRKVSRPSGSETKTRRGSERSAGRERGSTASFLGKECLQVASVRRSVIHQKMLEDYFTI